MDENNNGPVPGIIGQDVPSEPVETVPSATSEGGQDKGKVFDSSVFTGVKQSESISFTADGEEINDGTNRPKNGSLFGKWQFWIIASDAVLAIAVAALFVMIISYDSKLASSNWIARYDSLSRSVNDDKDEFKKKLTEYTKIVYTRNVKSYSLTIDPTSDTDPSKYLYPTENDIHIAGNNCLKQEIYGLTDEDIAYAETHKSGVELQSEGKKLQDEAERLEKIDNAYRNAKDTIENCHEPLLNVKLDDFKIELSDAEYEEKNVYVDVRRKIRITYNGERELKDFVIFYGMQDKNGLNAEFQYANYVNTGKTLKKGDVIETRLCGYKYSTTTSIGVKERDDEDLNNLKH